MTRICKKCNQEKDDNEFYPTNSYCKHCIKIKQYIRTTEKILINRQNITTKFCKKCNQEKDINEFYATSFYCKNCIKNYQKGYYQTHRESQIEYAKNYYRRPGKKEYHRKIARESREKHKEKINRERRKAKI